MDLLHACNNIIKILMNQSPLHMESALLSRFLYKFDRKFRNDMGYKIFKKINTALRKYLTINLIKDIQNFIAALPTVNQDKYLPTRQMLEYIMVRIMSFSKIMIRICVCSKQAAIYYMNRIKRGESHWMSLMPYALMSRIWTMSSVLLEHSCSWYSSLYPHLKQLQIKGLEFLPTGYTMPCNLDSWLDIKNLDHCGKFEWTLKKRIHININFADDEVNFDSILDYVKSINSEEIKDIEITPLSPKLLPTPEVSAMPCVDSDQGVSISREYFQSFYNNQKMNKPNDHYSENVTNKITLDKFLSKEENYRNEGSELSLTKHLSFMQWQTLKANLVKLSDTLSKNRKIERKFKKIWKEKCLDYL